MLPNPTRQQILAQYRKARGVNTPLEAITKVGQHYAHWAMTHHGLGLFRNRDADHAAWQECNLIGDEIMNRAMTPTPTGEFWLTGKRQSQRAVIELYCMKGLPAERICECPTIECALKHAVDHLRMHPGCCMKLLNAANGKISPEFTDALSVHDWADLAQSLQ